MKEQYLEQKLRLRVKALGGLALKFTSPGFNSVPDRVVLLNGKAWFVEVKRPGKKPTLQQLACHLLFLHAGFKVRVINSSETLKEFLNEIQSV